MTIVLLEKKLGGLRPGETSEGHRVLSKIGEGETVLCDVKDMARRSNRQHAYWFAIANHIFDNQTYFKDFNDFRTCFLISMGYYHITKIKGMDIPIVTSLKFGVMSNDEFNQLVDRTLERAEDMGFDTNELRNLASYGLRGRN